MDRLRKPTNVGPCLTFLAGGNRLKCKRIQNSCTLPVSRCFEPEDYGHIQPQTLEPRPKIQDPINLLLCNKYIWNPGSNPKPSKSRGSPTRSLHFSCKFYKECILMMFGLATWSKFLKPSEKVLDLSLSRKFGDQPLCLWAMCHVQPFPDRKSTQLPTNCFDICA